MGETVRRCGREGEQEERAGLHRVQRAWNSPEMERNQTGSRHECVAHSNLPCSIPTFATFCSPKLGPPLLRDHQWYRTCICGALTHELVASVY